eukprot:TRINITY_DN3704_c0_g1_i2.p1 TRINITY_DN3704_c0_g1~~TRINITY_DN3704_c0_g1_i2.p1  ORF type:complete len:505 (-),score=140.64 TRINITY_DN3704_c0_g1_i2:1363-2877(-)
MTEASRLSAQSSLYAINALADILRTSLGPKGAQKLIKDDIGDVVQSNDGATILRSLNIQHPVARMLVDVSLSQDHSSGDGTTTVVLLTAELFSEATKLMKQKHIHPMRIAEGFTLAMQRAVSVIDAMAVHLTSEQSLLHSVDDAVRHWKQHGVFLARVATTALASKHLSFSQVSMANLAVESVLNVLQMTEGKVTVPADRLLFVRLPAGSTDDSRLVNGIALLHRVTSSRMPRMVQKARVLCVDVPLTTPKFDNKVEYVVSAHTEQSHFAAQEERQELLHAQRIIKTGATVVFSSKDIGPICVGALADAGIMVIRSVAGEVLRAIACLSGAAVLTALVDTDTSVTGVVDCVRESYESGEYIVLVESATARFSTILLHGAATHLLDESQRSLHDAQCVLRKAIESGALLPGGGAVETEIATQLFQYANTVSFEHVDAVTAFANALLALPRILAANAGWDGANVVSKLQHQHSQGYKMYGINVLTGDTVCDDIRATEQSNVDDVPD